MPFVTPDTLGEYDVIVVGSGAAGGQTAYTLAMEGAKVLMLEAGRNYVPGHETPMFQHAGPGAAARHGDAGQAVRLLRRDGRRRLAGAGRALLERVEDDAERQFDWWRARMLGGRTNHWGRISLRNGPYDFKPQQPRRARVRLADRATRTSRRTTTRSRC